MTEMWFRPGIVLSLLVLGAVATVATWPPKPDPVYHALLTGAQIDTPLLHVFARACQDCHSENTHYLWYSYVFPASWWTGHHVASGRRHLNLSRWSEYPLVRKERLLSEIANQVRDGGMPLSSYTLIHRDARLSEADVNAIFQWTQKERARLIAGSGNSGSLLPQWISGNRTGPASGASAE